MKQIEKMKEIYLKQKAKEVNCLTILEEKFAYGREAGNKKSKEKKTLGQLGKEEERKGKTLG